LKNASNQMNPSLASHKHPPQRLLLVAVANHNVETGKVGKVSANKCGRKPEKEKKEMGEKEQGQSWSPSFPSILCRNRFFAE
jgi:hypothetical protein